MTDRIFRCKASHRGIPCKWEGNNDEAGEHEAETGHARCVIESCGSTVRADETRVCQQCTQRTRDAITTIRDADLEPVLEAAAERAGEIPVNLLTMVAAGNTDVAL